MQFSTQHSLSDLEDTQPESESAHLISRAIPGNVADSVGYSSVNGVFSNNHNNNGSVISESITSSTDGARSLPSFSRLNTSVSGSFNQYSTKIVLIVSLPQIIASIIILKKNWNNPILVCDSDHELRWRIWSVLSALRIAVFALLVIVIDFLRNRTRYYRLVLTLKNLVDGFGLFWFIVGNVWLLGDNNCIHAKESPIYNLCYAMLAINYLQIFLPCIMGVLIIPFFCFGMPCLIRVIARVSRPSSHTVGANRSEIDSVPSTILTEGNITSIGCEDMSCSICLNDMVIGENVKKLGCTHMFHKLCLDEWLLINNTCPSCRQRPTAPISHDAHTSKSSFTKDSYDFSAGSTRIRSNSRSLV